MKNSRSSGVTLRAICIGLALIPINSYFSIQTPTPTTTSLIYTSIVQLCLLAGINSLLRTYTPRWSLAPGELLTIYVMLNLAACLSGHDMMQVLGPILGHAFWFATPENDWKELFWSYLPKWLTVSDRQILRGHYEGHTTLYSITNLKAWFVPVFWWSTFLVGLGVVMLCLNVLIRQQWVEEEKLSYPIIRLPLELTSEGAGRLWTNRLLLAGLALAGSIDLINGLHAIYPMAPSIPTRNIEVGHFFTEKPLSAIGWTPICFFPFVIGLSFFMPLDLSFSCWVFYWVWKAQMVMGSALGLRSLPEFPYIKSQAAGAYCALGLMALYNIRRHLAAVFKKSRGGWRTVPTPEKQTESTQVLSYRLALLGLILGSAFLIGFSLKAGMVAWVVIPFLSIYFALSLAITRIRAELGPPVNEFYNMGPDQMLPKIFGARRLGPQTLTVFALFWGFNRSNRCHLMPHQLEGFKMAEQVKISPYRLTWAMLLATIVGALSAFWAYLRVRYAGEEFGGGFGWEAFNNLQRWLYYQPPPDTPAIAFMGFGFSATSLLMMLRWRFVWWPLHPIGYVLAESVNWSMSWMWSSIFISWAVKAILLRHGGIKAYRRSVPFFLGLILGDYLVGGGWNIYDVLTHRHTYTFWH